MLASLIIFIGPQVSPTALKWLKIAELSGLRAPPALRGAAGVVGCDSASHPDTTAAVLTAGGPGVAVSTTAEFGAKPRKLSDFKPFESRWRHLRPYESYE